jgi:glycosyltransferase involved in cell wall biosynthesis
MPSKLYGILASGTPLLVIAAEDCELSQLTRDEDIGFVVPPADPQALATTIRACTDQPESLTKMGHRASRLATERFDRSIATASFARLVRGALLPCSHHAPRDEPGIDFSSTTLETAPSGFITSQGDG